jgi:hypothetical protein
MTRLKPPHTSKTSKKSSRPKKDRPGSSREFDAKPVEGPVDHEKLRKKTMTRFAKTIARLAK